MRTLIFTIFVLCSTNAFPMDNDWVPTNDDVLDYILGMEVPPFEASLIHPPMKMSYKLNNTYIGHASPAEYGAHGYYEIGEDAIRIRFTSEEGFITGYMTSLITRTDVPDFKYQMEGNFTIHAVNSTINMTVLFPKIDSKTSPLVMTECSASYDRISIDLDAKNIKDSLDMIAMNHWLSRAMHETLSELYCIAIRKDVAKGTKSVAVKGIIGIVIQSAFRQG
ncbi:uncharacterized protein LOC120347659 [Styela clava]